MPYFNHNNLTNDYHLNDELIIPTIATFSKDGNFKPILLRYKFEDGSQPVITVVRTNYFRDYGNYRLFNCVVCLENKYREINICFYYREHVWILC